MPRFGCVGRPGASLPWCVTWWRSQTPKFWPPFHSPEGLATTVPVGVPSVVPRVLVGGPRRPDIPSVRRTAWAKKREGSPYGTPSPPLQTRISKACDRERSRLGLPIYAVGAVGFPRPIVVILFMTVQTVNHAGR